MQNYLDLIRKVLETGSDRDDRTGTGTRSLFVETLRFNLADGFPLMTTKQIHFKSVLYELLWFLRGDTNIRWLVENGVNIWNEWPYRAWLRATNQPDQIPNSEEWRAGMKTFISRIKEDADYAQMYGELGPVYGKQWRRWLGADGAEYDQIAAAIDQIKNNPNSRRIIVTAWNPSDTEEMAKAGLPPCHCFFQFQVVQGRLSCHILMRSCDMFLGVPFNIASYALLTMMMAQVCNLQPGELVWTGNDVHIYSNHFEQVREQLSRRPKPLPRLKLSPVIQDIDGFRPSDVELVGYEHHAAIRAPVAV